MRQEQRDGTEDGGRLYRLEIRGTLGRDGSRWFGADTVSCAGPNTVLLLRVADQSDLHGRLRRVHDLNLELVAVQRLDDGSGP